MLIGIDGRSATARRYRDLIAEISNELGDFNELSEVHRALVKQAAALLLRAEQLQSKVVRGEAVDDDLLVRLSAEARRMVVAISTARHGLDDDTFPERHRWPGTVTK